jgi:hypothetical protein
MKVFVDECVPYQLIHHLIGHDIVHVTDTAWRSTKNGALLRLVAPLNQRHRQLTKEVIKQ